MLDETVLLDSAKKGDQDALNALVSRHWHPLYRLAYAKTGSPEDAQELTQETFFRAFRALPTYRQTGAAFKTYLSHIANNLIVDFWRKKGRAPAISDLSEQQEPRSNEEPPDVQAINQEQRAAISRVLRELPPDQRQAVELRIMAGISVKETAVAMGKSEAAVKMLQQRALKNLRSLLLERGVVESNVARR